MGTEEAIWSRLLESEVPAIPSEVARFLLTLDFRAEDKGRMRELAAKARAGTLTVDEQGEVDAYGRVGSFLGILQSKARNALRPKPTSRRSTR
jgi:hypothetical protein